MQLLTLRSWQTALLLHSCKAVMQAVMHVKACSYIQSFALAMVQAWCTFCGNSDTSSETLCALLQHAYSQ